MRNRFDRQLVQLNDEMIEMGSMIERAIQQAITALIKQDTEAAQKIIEYDEDIDQQEKSIENLVSQFHHFPGICRTYPCCA